MKTPEEEAADLALAWERFSAAMRAGCDCEWCKTDHQRIVEGEPMSHNKIEAAVRVIAHYRSELRPFLGSCRYTLQVLSDIERALGEPPTRCPYGVNREPRCIQLECSSVAPLSEAKAMGLDPVERADKPVSTDVIAKRLRIQGPLKEGACPHCNDTGWCILTADGDSLICRCRRDEKDYDRSRAERLRGFVE